MSCDPNFNDVVLLLSMDGADNSTVFVDSSPAVNTVTAQGDARMEATSPTPKFGYAAGFFDGSGDFLSMPITADLDLSSGDPFTLEGWFLLNSTASSTAQLLLGCRDNTNSSGYTVAIRPDTGLLSFQMFGSGGASCNASFAVAAGNWYHFAVVWDGTNFRAYLNGNGGTPVSSAGGFTPFAAAQLRVGADAFSGVTGSYFDGSLDEFRITNGAAVYTGNFPPPTEPFPLVTCTPDECDGLFDQVGVLLALTGPNTGTTFLDLSNNALTVTPSGDVQTLNTNGSPFGAGSAADFGSSSVGALDIPAAASGPLDLARDFTLEFWFRADPGVTADFVLADLGNFAGGTGMLLWGDYSGGAFSIVATPGSGLTGWTAALWDNVPLSLGVWYHLTLIHRGTSGYLAINGAFDSSTGNSWNSSFISAPKLRFGNKFTTPVSAPFAFKGQMADIRITKNIARYDGVTRFAPPLDYYVTGQCAVECDPAYDGVTALVQIVGGVFDDVTGNSAVSIIGGGSISSAQSIYGGSSFLNPAVGSARTNYVELVSANVNAFNPLVNEEFTVEAWIFVSSPPTSYPWIFSANVNQGSTGWWGLQFNASSGETYLHGDGLAQLYGGPGTLPLGAWAHVAVTRVGPVLAYFVNGRQIGGVTNTNAFGPANGTFWIGANCQPAAGDNSDFPGYIANFRFTKGAARYLFGTPFIPQPPAFPDFVCGVQCDPLFADVSTLLTMDGTNGSTSFPDDSNNALTWTANNGAAVETAQVKFGTGALDPDDGTSGFISSPIVAPGPLYLSDTDFTVEFWAYWNTVSGLTGVLNYGNALSSLGFRMYMNSGGLTCQMLMGSWGSISGPFTMVANTWYHIAVVRKGGESRMFVNGYANNTQPALGAPTMSGDVSVGKMQFGTHDGFIDEFRVTKAARYWDGFMPPQQSFGLICIGTVPVPDVEGDSLAAATVAIEAVGLVAGTVTYEFSGTHAVGTVIETDPPAGTDALLGSTVDFVVSLGTEAIVPNVVGLDATDATAALATAGLVLGVIGTAYSDTYAVDLIISQDPVAGTSVSAGDAVDVVRSLGPTPVSVPNVVTFPLDAAVTILVSVGLIVGAVSQAYSEEIEFGSVMSQSPSAGATVPPGAAVDLVTSLGPAVVSVPDVLGLSASDASDVIRGASLRVGRITVDTSGTFPIGTIAAEEPNAGALVPSGTKINLVLSSIAPPFDADATVISQYQQSPTLVQMVEDFAVYIDPRTNLTLFYSLVWNVDTAQGFGLDVWGKIVGVSRLLRIVADDPKFGFDNESTPPPDWQPFGQGRFARGGEEGEAVILPDDAYRILILTKALANIASTSAAAINQLLRNLFPGRGKAYVEDLGGMSMRFVFDFALTPVEYAIVSQSGALPHPAGVSLSVSVPP